MGVLGPLVWSAWPGMHVPSVFEFPHCEECNQWYEMSQSSCVRYTYCHLLAVSVPLLFSRLFRLRVEPAGYVRRC